MVPFLVKPEDPEIQVLQDAFQFVTGDTEHEPFTIGGGTYAREFSVLQYEPSVKFQPIL